jgi:hypothetical protein
VIEMERCSDNDRSHHNPDHPIKNKLSLHK